MIEPMITEKEINLLKELWEKEKKFRDDIDVLALNHRNSILQIEQIYRHQVNACFHVLAKAGYFTIDFKYDYLDDDEAIVFPQKEKEVEDELER